MDAVQLNPRVRAIAEVLLCSSVPTQLLIASALRTSGWMAFDDSGQLSLPFVFTLSVVDTLVLVALMAGLTLARGERVSDLWWGTRPIGREIAVGAMLIPIVFLMVVVLLNLLMALAPWLHNVPTNPLEQMAGTAGGAAVLAVVAILAGGVREELQRAFLLRRFEDHLGGPAVGLVVLSIAFGLGHIVQGFDAVITTALLGAFWAALYLRRRSVIAPVVSHAGFNTLEVLRVALFGQ
jgi:membrane protease YdiL (CAAX protease family)